MRPEHELRRDRGQTISDRAERNVVLLAERTEISVTWSRYAAGERGPELHVHREHTDAFYVLEGELTFGLGPEPEQVRVPAGGFVAVPPDVAHSFRNESAADTRWLNFHAPDRGFGAYLRAARNGADFAFDSFDPPPDGGLPPGGTVLAGPGEGERLAAGALLKAALPELCVAEWSLDGPPEGVPDGLFFVSAARVVTIHAPGGEAADSLRRAAGAPGPPPGQR